MRYLWIILGCVLVVPMVMAQRMRVEDLGRYKKPFLGKAAFATDKRFALLDLVTSEKGFEFSTAGGVAVEATEGGGFVSLAFPH